MEQMYAFLAEQTDRNQRVIMNFLRHPDTKFIFDEIAVKFQAYTKNLYNFLQQCIELDLVERKPAQCFFSDEYRLSPRLAKEKAGDLKSRLEELFLV